MYYRAEKAFSNLTNPYLAIDLVEHQDRWIDG